MGWCSGNELAEDLYMNRQENAVIFSHCDELTNFIRF